jgi:hypothetical protein
MKTKLFFMTGILALALVFGLALTGCDLLDEEEEEEKEKDNGGGAPSSWTPVTTSTFSSYIYGVTYGGGNFVAVNGSGRMAYSSDGITWTEVPGSSPFGTLSIYGVTYGAGKFIAVGGNGLIAYSN